MPAWAAALASRLHADGYAPQPLDQQPICRAWARKALHHHARDFLERLHIDEPLTWEPPASCAHLHLPGPEITDIDREAVRRLIVDEGHRPTDAARHLGTTLTHVRFALEIIDPAPAESRGPSPLEAWRLRQRASSILTREFLDREYVQAGRNLTQIAQSVGLPRNVVVEQAKALGVTIYRTRRPVAMDPKWLRKQYLVRKRTTQDIAREIGAENETVQEFYGAQISARTGIGDGSVSTRLRQLEQASWLPARLEDDDSWHRRATPGRGPGRRRTYYALTPEGRRAASYEVERGTFRTRKEHSSHDG